MSLESLLDAAGRRRSPATMPGFRAGVAPGNMGQRYPADPPTVDEIVAVMRQAGHDRHGHRLTALIVMLWRAGLRIHEALSLTETHLDGRRGSLLIGHGKNDRRREVGMDAWRWSAIEPWLADRLGFRSGRCSAAEQKTWLPPLRAGRLRAQLYRRHAAAAHTSSSHALPPLVGLPRGAGASGCLFCAVWVGRLLGVIEATR